MFKKRYKVERSVATAVQSGNKKHVTKNTFIILKTETINLKFEYPFLKSYKLTPLFHGIKSS